MTDRNCHLPEFGACCCTCANRLNDWSHPDTDGGQVTERRGFVCVAKRLGPMSGWPEHSMCELHQLRPDRFSDPDDAKLWDRLYGEPSGPAADAKEIGQ